MDESAVGTQFDFGETNNVATGIRTINLERPIIYAHNNKRSFSAFCSGTRRPQAWRNMQMSGFRCRPCAIYVRLLFSVWQFPA